MRFTMIFCCLFCFCFLSEAQVKVDGKATGKHAKVINQTKGARQTAKERRAQAKKLKEQAEARKLYKLKYDSIESYRRDSLSIEVISKEDSIQIAEDILAETNFPLEYKELILNPIVLNPTINTEGADSVALAKSTALLENEAKEFLPEELNTVEDPMSGLTNPADGLNSPEEGLTIPSKPNPNLVKPEKAQELFKKIDPEQFQEAQADIQKLKKKYSELPDTRYPEEGTKRNSLEDAPFKNRIYFGGNLTVQSTDPFILDSNLQLGYWINKKWLGGVGITLREQFNNEDSTSLLTGDGHGYSLFTRYDIPKGFFAWAEVERQVNRSFFGAENPTPAQWQSAYMVGVGREFKIGFVQMISMILYDFNYRNNDLNARPLVFKFGVRFTKKPGD
ncbi:hypothetical protein [Ekhidna sp.]